MDITRTSKEEIHSIEGRDLFKDTEGPRDSMGNEDGYSHKPTHGTFTTRFFIIVIHLIFSPCSPLVTCVLMVMFLSSWQLVLHMFPHRRDVQYQNDYSLLPQLQADYYKH